MHKTQPKHSRRQHILEALSRMLEHSPGERITTAGLAREVGVSEAALYRHFPSKGKMFEGLIEELEAVVQNGLDSALALESRGVARCERLLSTLLNFLEQHPGITRLLTGDALTGEAERLRGRVQQFFTRLERELTDILQEAERRESLPHTPHATARLMLTLLEGRLCQFVRSEFRQPPSREWHAQWGALLNGLRQSAPIAVNG